MEYMKNNWVFKVFYFLVNVPISKQLKKYKENIFYHGNPAT